MWKFSKAHSVEHSSEGHIKTTKFFTLIYTKLLLTGHEIKQAEQLVGFQTKLEVLCFFFKSQGSGPVLAVSYVTFVQIKTLLQAVFYVTIVFILKLNGSNIYQELK